jgi:hypothetical protein
MFRRVSLETTTGKIKNSRELIGRWGNLPFLFATNDGTVILEQGVLLTALKPDLTDSGLRFAPNGLLHQVSPDGSTLA